ncbi:TetR/AcrR family transcriptional regulator [Actinomadura harenae]|uniref:TetR/AcrR family transcriptional regulator n=1 Tax=Actinomadura harenae TaxID=2483351 RepID=A0A3M2M1X3_9ACTN|nr:TetR/AcrR family transcriptional regulator [Actinomadura harenae]RMI43452.1 TetR/AcrR family transcriptional regulator [Actinomadura harenae]
MTENRRGRPRAFDRDAALASATRLFWERGYEATSIGDLTEAMGIRPASLYAAFGDKKALFREVVEEYQRTETAGFAGRALAEEPTVARAFARALRDAVDIYTDPSHPAGCLIIRAATNVAPRDAEIETYLRDIRNANVDGFAERVREAVGRGELPDGTDPRAMAQLFATVLQGLSQRAGDGATAADLRPAVEMALAALPGSRD